MHLVLHTGCSGNKFIPSEQHNSSPKWGNIARHSFDTPHYVPCKKIQIKRTLPMLHTSRLRRKFIPSEQHNFSPKSRNKLKILFDRPMMVVCVEREKNPNSKDSPLPGLSTAAARAHAADID